MDYVVVLERQALEPRFRCVISDQDHTRFRKDSGYIVYFLLTLRQRCELLPSEPGGCSTIGPFAVESLAQGATPR